MNNWYFFYFKILIIKNIMCENINIVKIGSDSINEQNLRKIIDDAKKWEKQTGEKFIFISS